MSQFEKYLTGNSYTGQKHINDGVVVLTATFTGDDNDSNALIIDERKPKEEHSKYDLNSSESHSKSQHKNTEEHFNSNSV